MKDEPSVDFLKEKYQLAPTRKRSRRGRKTIKVVAAVMGIVALGGLVFSYRLAQTPIAESPDSGHFSFFSSMRRLVTSGDKELTGEDDDRINFLLLGHGGAGHAGPELTDTIIFTSFRPSTSEIGMMSLPRDLIVAIPGYGYRKINHVNAYGELDETGSGAEVTADLIGEVLDQTVHYYIKVDFDGFEELLESIGGVDVYVDNAFTDYSYPTSNDLIQTVSFEEGWQHMDAETALQYSRSRHGTNGEGSDFARSRRQQKVILAVKEKVLSPAVLLSPGKLNRMIEIFQENVETNLTFWEMLKLARYAPAVQSENVNHYVLDASTASPLYASNINGAYVLLPKRDDWSEVQEIAASLFSSENAEHLAASGVEDTAKSARIEIQNGTSISGLAFEASQLLVSSGFDVQTVGNADNRDYHRTIIYDLSEGEKSGELAVLKEFLEADVAMSATGWIFADEVVPRELTVSTPGLEYLESDEHIDFLIILGQDAEKLVLR
jgi:LCP family protein required for cell wall assembly